MDKNINVTIGAKVSVTAEGIEQAKRQASEVQQGVESASASSTQLANSAAEAASKVGAVFERAFEGIPDKLNKALDRIDPNTIAEQIRRKLVGLAPQPTYPSPTSTSRPPVPLQPPTTSPHPHRPEVSPEALAGRVTRGLVGVEAGMAGARTHSDFERLEGRLQSLQSYVQSARQAGAPEDEAKRLEERIEALTESLDRNRKALEDARKAPVGAGGEGNGDGGNKPPPASEESEWLKAMKSLASTGMNSLGPVGRMLGKAGPWGLGIGAAVGGFNLLTGGLTAANREARDEIQDLADLARQYGYDNNPLTFFRGRDLMTKPELMKLGYTATDAARIAAGYNLPGGMQQDTQSILAFARTTGMDEDQVTAYTRAIGVNSNIGRGRVGQEALEQTKLAMVEGIKQGIAQSDTMKGLLDLARQSASRGNQLTAQGFQTQAGLLRSLAQSGNRALQGDMGADAASKLTSAMTGEGDMALELMLMSKFNRLPTAQELGLEGGAAAGYKQLASKSPVMAFQQALNLLRDGRNPQALAQITAHMQASMGPLMTAQLLESYGLKGEQLLGVLGGTKFTFNQQAQAIKPGQPAGWFDAAAKTGAFGQDLTRDPQGLNALANQSLMLDVSRQEVKTLESYAKAAAFGGLEAALRNIQTGLAKAGAQALLKIAPDITGDWEGGATGVGTAKIPSFPTGPEYPDAPKGFDTYEQRLKMMGATKVIQGLGENANNPAYGYGAKGHLGRDYRIGKAGVGGDVIRNPWEGAEVIKVGFDPEIKDPKTGKIIKGGLGNYIHLRLPDGTLVKMGHFESIGEKFTQFQPGQKLKFGEKLGLEGMTGTAFGPHLHVNLYDEKGSLILDDPEWDRRFMQLEPGSKVPSSPKTIQSMMNGTEARSPSDTNPRTGAFGWTQIMPSNLIGAGRTNAAGAIQGWDRAFGATAEGKKLAERLKAVGLNPNDPVPDLEAIKTRTPGMEQNLGRWYKSLKPDQQTALTEYLNAMSAWQLKNFQERAKNLGAGDRESMERSWAAWYAGPGWLDPKNPAYSLDDKNSNFTRGHGKDTDGDGKLDSEPSVKEYIQRMYDNMPKSEGQPQTMIVKIEGLENITVNGRPNDKVSQGARLIAEGVAENWNHRGS